MDVALEQAEILTDEQLHDILVDIPVSVDGSWLTRGKQSRHGFVTVISVDTGDVLDR